jgi:anti-sigma regulatory factor (Ser/Thr protein kinase)
MTALPTAVACGRLHTKQVLWEWQLDRLVDDAVTLVSELLTNAIKASWSPAGKGLVALRLLANHEQLFIEVWDQSPDDPRPRVVDDEAESGRGFAVIEALSYGWGWQRVGVGLKVVWCEMRIEWLR